MSEQRPLAARQEGPQRVGPNLTAWLRRWLPDVARSAKRVAQADAYKEKTRQKAKGIPTP